MWKVLAGAAAFLSLAACEGKPLTFEGTPLSVQRFYADTFQDKAFDEGAVTVIYAEHGELRTLMLTPCDNGQHICGSRQGHLQVTQDYAIITDAYPGRTFFLSPGGDGYMRRHGELTPLAWNE